MNADLYVRARRAGCSRAEAEILAVMVDADSLKAAAALLNLDYRSASNHMSRAKRRLGVRHIPALVAKLQAAPS